VSGVILLFLRWYLHDYFDPVCGRGVMGGRWGFASGCRQEAHGVDAAFLHVRDNGFDPLPGQLIGGPPGLFLSDVSDDHHTIGIGPDKSGKLVEEQATLLVEDGGRAFEEVLSGKGEANAPGGVVEPDGVVSEEDLGRRIEESVSEAFRGWLIEGLAKCGQQEVVRVFLDVERGHRAQEFLEVSAVSVSQGQEEDKQYDEDGGQIAPRKTAQKRVSFGRRCA